MSTPRNATSFFAFEKFFMFPISAKRIVALIFPTSGCEHNSSTFSLNPGIITENLRISSFNLLIAVLNE